MIRVPLLAVGTRLLTGGVLLVLLLFSSTCYSNDITTLVVPSRLSFRAQPGSTTAGDAINPAVKVAALDVVGRVVTSFTGNVTLVIGTDPGGGTLAGITTVAAVDGVATFPSLSLTRMGTGYTLTATATGLSSATSAPFNILAGLPAQLAFTVQPASAVAGAMISPAVQVSAQDEFGNAVSSFTGNVTVAIAPGTGASGAALSGTTTVAAANGVATFSSLSITKSGSVYALSATATDVTGVSSASFAITSGGVNQLTFTGQPTTTVTDHQITPAVRVTALDTFGNLVSSYTGDVMLALTPGTGTSGATLGGTTTVALSNGVATFSAVSISTSGIGYTLTATTAGLTATSMTFNIGVPGQVTQLAFTVQPASTVVGEPIGPPVQVTAQDAAGNTATSFTGSVTATITAGTGSSGATLLGTTVVAAVAGVSTFSALCIDRSGSGYTLTAASGGLTGATSAPFTVPPGGLIQLVFTVQPSTTLAGATIAPAVQVSMLDAQGNVNATPCFKPGNVTVSLGTNPGGGTLAGTTTVALVNRVATFSRLSIDKVGAGYTLTAVTTGALGATSRPFNIQ